MLVFFLDIPQTLLYFIHVSMFFLCYVLIKIPRKNSSYYTDSLNLFIL